jgi:PAS domain S-box-containing protein
MGVGRSITLVQYQPKKTTVVVDETCPYQGLKAFDKEQARFFFGREKVVQWLTEKLGQANFVPIIGASGSGKSSVVRAGLIPLLEKNGWQVLEPILPGDEPLAELKTSLIELFGRTEGREVYSLIKTDGLRPVIERLSASERLLLVVDQFEEVFTVCPKEEERRQFIELLTQVSEIPASRLAIVTTMRADFLEPCLSYESLTQLIQDKAVYMPPLVGAELEEAIAAPANLQGYHLETGLLGAILHDVGQEKGCLPLLQFALTELWEQRDRQTYQLTLGNYKQLNGVIGALNRHAEEIYKGFTQQEQDWVKRIFLKLVRTGLQEKDTRQRQPKSKLFAIAGDSSVNQQALSKVLDRLVDGRLLVTDQEGEDEVDLAHEALIEGWKRFTEWRQEDRELRRLVDRVEDALREWQKNPQDENLMMGGLLAQVQEQWEELESELSSALAKEFYQQSDAYEHRRLEEAEMVRRRLEEAEIVRRAEEKYRSIMENATEGIFQATPEGHYITANSALAKIYGYSSPEELMVQSKHGGKDLYVDPMRHEDLAALLQKFDTLSDVESEVYRKDGSIIWISENIRSVRDANGTLLYYEGSVADITERREAEVALRSARKKAELLLLNVLPQPIAERLKQGPHTIAESFEEVTVLFADLVDFTKFWTQISPTELVELLNEIFSKFDRLAQKHNVEKIKTIGYAYMAVAGLPTPRPDHAPAMAQMALDMQAAIAQFNVEMDVALRLRIGINSGSAVAGIIGIKKFSYDLWGDTVDIASLIESHGIPGCIQVTPTTYDLLRDLYLFEERGIISVKDKGDMMAYLLTGRK